MAENFARIKNEDLDGLTIGKLFSWTLDFDGLKTARQLVYNRQKKYIGCSIDTSVAPKASNIEGFFNLVIKRESYGKTHDGTWEPGTPEKWIKEHQQ